MGISIPGELYCLSSEPLSKKEYFLKFKFKLLKAFKIALSENVFPFLVGI